MTIDVVAKNRYFQVKTEFLKSQVSRSKVKPIDKLKIPKCTLGFTYKLQKVSFKYAQYSDELSEQNLFKLQLTKLMLQLYLICARKYFSGFSKT